MPTVPLARTIFAFLFALLTAVDLQAQSTLIPLATRRDMVFDHAGKYLYITTSDGFVRPYNLLTGQLETGSNLGGSLNGVDIAPNDSFLLIAQNNTTGSEGTFHKLDLRTGALSNINYPLDSWSHETGAWDVAIASNGVALATTQGPDSSEPPLHQIDLATNIITRRNDIPTQSSIPGVLAKTQLQRSADGTRLYLLGAGGFTYSAVTNSFDGKKSVTGGGFASAAVSRDGGLLATRSGIYYGGSIDTAPDFNFVRSFYQFNSGVSFDATRDVVYAVDMYANQIIAFDTTTFAELFRLDIGEDVYLSYSSNAPFDTGTLVASQDGRYLALETPSGIRLFAIPSPPYPTLSPKTFGDPRDMVFDHSSRYLYVTTTAGFVLRFNVSTTALEATYDVGGWLYGMDIAPDDSFVIVAQAYPGIAQGAFQKLDLVTGKITNLNYPRTGLSERGAYDVAIASNGRAFGTTTGDSVPLREIDLSTNAISVRTSPASHWGDMSASGQIQRSADGSRLYFLEPYLSNGPRFVYDTATDSFTAAPSMNTYFDLASAAVNRNGTLLSTRFSTRATLDSPTDFDVVINICGLDGGVAFSAVDDTLYGVNSVSNQIVAYDTNSFVEKFRIDIGEDVSDFTRPFGVGTLVASQDGRFLAMFTPSAIVLFDVQNPPASSPARFGNISTRAMIRTGDEVAIAGFIIKGTDAKKVLMRAVGPSLFWFAVQNALQDTTLELHDQSGAVIASNDNWKDSQQSQIQASGLAPSDDRESVIVKTLSPGAYTAIIRGKNNSTGAGLIEVYDLDPNTNSKLANISTRAVVDTYDNVMIGGLIVNGPANGPGSEKILIRGVGPSLTQHGVSNALQDPVLELHDGNGGQIASNDNWRDTQQTEIQATGLGPSDDREPALVVNVTQGNYTAILSGKNNTVGLGLVEVYALQ
jgi:hypothetical protein